MIFYLSYGLSFMSSGMNYDFPTFSNKKAPYSRTRIGIFVFEITIIFTLLIIWLSFDSIQKSKSLLVLFFYCFPSEFLVGLVPHEPILLYYGKFYSPLTVTLVSIIGTVLAEAMNYSVFKFFMDTNLLQEFISSKTVTSIIRLFTRAPFIAICIAGFTPVPFYPFRFIVVISRYSRLKYLIAVFLSRAPRFFILAQIGYTFKIPGFALLIIFFILIVTINVHFIGNLIKKIR